MLPRREPVLPLKHISPIHKQSTVESKTVGHSRHRGACVTERPVSRMQLMDPSPRVTANVGGIIPSAVEHNSPPHELRPWIVRIAIVIEEVCHCESTGRDRVAIHRT